MGSVLLIEPNRALGQTYLKALEHAGHRVCHVTGAQEAIQAADEREPDIVLLEMRLAVHDGVEFLHEFRSYAEWQKIPVVLNTYIEPSLLEPVRVALERDFGVNRYLYKPHTSLEQLVSIVNQALAS
jgi:CheY-like chemotaxis protein